MEYNKAQVTITLDNLTLARTILAETKGYRDDAKNSLDHVLSSEANASDSENKAKQSEINAKTSETNAKASELNAKASEDRAKTSELNAKTSENNAKASEDKAKISEINAKASEDKAKASELICIDKASVATTQAGIAVSNATITTNNATNARRSEENAKQSETNSANSASSAFASATSASNSAAVCQNIVSEAAEAVRGELGDVYSTSVLKAEEAAASARSAASSASTATTQAGIASNKATEANNKLTEATAQANLAKGYAEDAQASADRAMSTTPAGYEQLLDNVAAQSSENVKQNDNISLLNRKVSALEKMNEGVSYRFETDDTEAYTKTIRSGAKAFDLKMLGGASRKGYNIVPIKQLTTQVQNGVTITPVYENGALKKINVSGTNNSGNYMSYVLNDELSFSQGTYNMSCLNATYMAYTIIYTSTWGGLGNAMNKKTFTVDSNGQQTCRYRLYIDSTFTGNVDLYPMVEEGAVAHDYEPYTDQIISASVGNVKVQGKNLWDFKSFLRERGATFTEKDGVFTSNIPYAIYQKHEVLEIKQPCTISLAKATDVSGVSGFNSGGNTAGIYLFINAYTDNTYTTTRFVQIGRADQPATISASLQYGVKDLYFSWSGGQLTGKAIFYNPQIELGLTKTEYSPYTEQTITIPNECLNLEGYGWSAGDVYNEVDFENKKFIQRVGKVDLGSLNWGKSTFNVNYSTYVTRDVTNAKSHTYSESIGLLCEKGYKQLGRMTNVDEDKIIVFNSTSHTANSLYIADSAYADVNVFKQAMQGVYLYYELAEPIITDISDLLDNRFDSILCEANGTITFEGADSNYHLPVPNEEEYMVKLSEV